MSRYRFFRAANQPPEYFDTLREMARRITQLARHPNSGEHYDVVLAPGAISTVRGSGEPDTLPCAIVKQLRDQARDTLGYAVITGLDGELMQNPDACETLMRQLVILATPEPEPYVPGQPPRRASQPGWAA